MDNVIDFININRDRYLDELKAFLAIPSISALPEHAADVRADVVEHVHERVSHLARVSQHVGVIAAITDGVSGDLALDLYAGVGLISLALARGFSQVIAVEASQTSYKDLRHNAWPEVKACRATTEQFLARTAVRRADLVVADPPRAGLGQNVVRQLARLEARRLIYVSCDPSTLARDLRGLLDCGYKVENARLLDLFPQTFHIESVIQLTR